MNLHFLQANVPLTKTYKQTTKGLEKSSYPHMFEVTSHEEKISNLAQFEAAIKKHSKLGHCLLKGELTRTLTNESRAGSTDRNGTTQWICLDIDGLPETFASPTGTVKYGIQDLLRDLGLGEVSYVLQWSASHNIVDTRLRAHVFMLLDRPVAVALIKQWLVQLNHQTASLQANTTLTKTACSLSWVLDITACQNDKLIYITPPVLKGLKDPFGNKPRITIVRRVKNEFTFPSHTNSIATNRQLTDERIHELRAAANIPKRKLVYKLSGPHEVLAKPDASVVTETRIERGFVYFNLNGGDSWAYYHPENNPDYIFNFKGEPVYLTKELMPEYWAELCNQSSRTDSSGITYLAFLDRQTSTYWRGTYDAAQDVLDLNAAKNETMLRHFAGQYGMPLGDDIPEWTMTFDPMDSVRVDFANKTINTFQLTSYMKAKAKKVNQCPPTVFKVIHHALGNDADITVHFINWVAFILQFRTLSKTSWVLHGTQGTGKGVLMNNILRPIFGFSQTAVKRLEEFNEPYNGYMKQCFLVFVDEFQIKAMGNERGAMSKIKNFITEPIISLRSMYQNAHECENHTNWIFASNETDSITVPGNDRRTNVARYQSQKLDLAEKDIDSIKSELQSFHDFLLYYPVDQEAARTPLQTTDRDILISISENSLDSTSRAVLEGDMGFFIDQLPSSDRPQSNMLVVNRTENFKAVLKDVISRTDPTTGQVNVSRDELQVFFQYCNDKVPETAHKFTTMLKHHRIHTKKVRIGVKSVYGLAVTWKDIKSFGTYVKDHFTPKGAQVKR